jgi:arylsulfatase
VQELIDVWWAEAERNHVLPLDDSFIGRAGAMFRPAYGPRFRTVFKPGGGPVSEDVLPPLGAVGDRACRGRQAQADPFALRHG